MLEYNHPVYGELTRILKECTGNVLPVYNGMMITKPPKDAERIEFRLINFSSTGQIYQTRDVSGANFKVGTTSEYRCQLSIRVFDDPKNGAVLTGKIAGAIQTFEYLSGIVDELYIKNETMKIKPFTLQKDNIVVNYMEIIVDCYMAVFYENTVDYFTKVEDVDYDINK